MPPLDTLEEATDPTTDLERLCHLAEHWDEAVRRAAWKNPAVPEDVWRRALFLGKPEAWSKPMAPI